MQSTLRKLVFQRVKRVMLVYSNDDKYRRYCVNEGFGVAELALIDKDSLKH